MKRQLILLLFSMVGVMAVSTVAMAEVQPSISVEKASQEQQTMVKGSRSSVWSEVDNLDLSADQQEEIDAIRADVSDQMADILTAEQMQAFQAAQNNGDDMRSTM